MGGFALGGRFTTLEGLLTNIDDQVMENPFHGAVTGDSATDGAKQKMEEFRQQLAEMKAGKQHFTLILDDPAGNSYLQVRKSTSNPYTLIVTFIIRLFFCCLIKRQATRN